MTKASKVNAAGPLSNAAGSAGLAFCNRAGGGGESHGTAKCLTSQTTIRRKIPQKLVDMRSFFIQDSSFVQNILNPPAPTGAVFPKPGINDPGPSLTAARHS